MNSYVNSTGTPVFNLEHWYGADAPFYLTTIHKDGGGPVFCPSVEEAIKRNKDGHNVYLSANPLRAEFAGNKATEEDVAFIKHLVFDLDPPGRKSPEEERAQYLKATEWVRTHPKVDLAERHLIRPTSSFETGRCGCWVFRLSQPLENTSENRDRVKLLHSRMASKLLADATPSVDHLYKAPLSGTTAWMSKKKCDAGWEDRELGMVHWDDGQEYCIEDLEEFAGKGAVGSSAPSGGNGRAVEGGWFTILAPEDRVLCAEAMLETLNPNIGYVSWMRIGMALESVDDDFYEIWDKWSSGGASYSPGETSYKWRSFKKSGVSVGTLVWLSKEAGWDREAWLKARAKWYLTQVEVNGVDDPAQAQAVNRLLSLLPDADKRFFVKKLKAADRDMFSLKAVSVAAAEAAAEQDDEETDDMTHAQIAEDFVGKNEKLATVGSVIWGFNDLVKIWCDDTKLVKNRLSVDYENEKLCRTGSHYGQIHSCVMDRTEKPEFFSNAPKGIACGGYFYKVVKDAQEVESITVEPLNASHAQTFTLDYLPDYEGHDEMLLLQVLREGMDMTEEDSDAQLKTIQQVIGAGLFGLLPSTRKALMLQGPTSTGKTTLLNTVTNIMPPQAITSVPPTLMEDREAIQSLAWSRLNVVNELKDDASIAGAEFKAIVGGEPVAARKLYIGNYSMRPIAGHLFATNPWPTVKSPDSGFWERWAVVTFHKSRPSADRRNLDKELFANRSKILGWFMQGAAQFLVNGRQIELGAPHHRGMDKWKRRSDSVAAFLIDCDTIELKIPRSSSMPITQAQLFNEYHRWFVSSDYKYSLGKQTFYARVAEYGGNPGVRDGANVFNTYSLKMR